MLGFEVAGSHLPRSRWSRDQFSIMMYDSGARSRLWEKAAVKWELIQLGRPMPKQTASSTP